MVSLPVPLLSCIGGFLVVQHSLQPADVIHVIAGEDYRTQHAIDLFQQGYAARLFYTGGWCKFHHYAHGQHARQLSLAAGIQAEDIEWDDAAVTSTYAEAERLRQWIESSPRRITSVIVVSDPFHMRRVSWTYRWAFGTRIRIQLAPVPFQATPYRADWWNDAGSRAYVRREYEKLVYYILRYRLSRGKLRKWLAGLDVD